MKDQYFRMISRAKLAEISELEVTVELLSVDLLQRVHGVAAFVYRR